MNNRKKPGFFTITRTRFKIRSILKKEFGFENTLWATGNFWAKLKKPLANGARVHVKDIVYHDDDKYYVIYDIDLDDPERNGAENHLKTFGKWMEEGFPDKTVKIPFEKIRKKGPKFNWAKEYEKEFEKRLSLQGIIDYEKKY